MTDKDNQTEREKLYNHRDIGTCERLDDIWNEEKEVFENLRFKDSELEHEEPMEVKVYGNITLNEDEKNVLRARPELATYMRMLMTEIEQDVETTKTQIRWTRMKTGYKQEEPEEYTTAESKEWTEFQT